MYNSGRRGKRTNDGYGVISTADNFNQSEYPIPTVTSFSITDGSYSPLPDSAVDTAGGQTIVINGSGFKPGATVMVGGTTIGAVTYLDQGRLAFTAPALSSASYTIIVSNSNGGTGILIPGLVYSGLPTWSTNAGSVGSVYETKPIAQSFVATGDAPLTYALYSGTLPSGSSLQSDGTLSGTAPADSGSTTYSFTIRAYDAQNQHSDRSFSLTINTDTVTWSTPTTNQVITAYEYRPITNVTASATSAAGYGVLYSANSVPSGITLNANTGLISGNLAAAGNTYTQLTATANTTVRNATRNVIFNSRQDVVTWTTPNTNQVITAYEYTPITNVTANATSAAGFGVLYSSNATPTGITINANTGLISGTANTIGNTYSRLTATANTSTRSNTQDVIFNVNQDVVTWSSPADQTAYSLAGGSVMANVTLSATSAAGRSITYTANALPSGVGISGSVIYGTPNAAQTVTTLLTATAATTNRSATRTISWSVSLGDSNWKNVSFLLNGVTPTTSFINDASTNNLMLTINGDTRPSNFNPYTPGYYSNYFDGSTGYLSIPSSSAFSIATTTTPFTVEAWVYRTASGGCVFSESYTGSGTIALVVLFDNGSINTPSGDLLTLAYYNGSTWVKQAASSSSVALNTWVHIACVFTGSTTKIFVNGTDVTAAGALTTWASTGIAGDTWYVGRRWDTSAPGVYFPGYISNLRYVVGTAVYTSAFTPPTAPLTAITNTQLLTCQSNRLIDNSTNNFAITKNGDVAVSGADPFVANSSYASYGSAYFNGTNSYLTVATNSGVTFGTGDFTIECWVNANGIGGGSSGTVFHLSTSGTMYLRYQNSTTWAFLDPAGNRHDYTFNSTNSGYGQWVHHAIVRSSGTTTWYINGTSVYSGADSTSYAGTVLTIGTYPGAGLYWNGYISDFRIVKGTALYTSAFTPPTAPLTAVANTQLLTLQYNGGAHNSSFVDQSSFNNIITRNGNVTQGTFSPYSQTGWSTYFNGSSIVRYSGSGPADFGTGNFTIEMWVNISVNTGAWQAFYDSRVGGTGLFFGLDSGGLTLIYYRGGILITDSAPLVLNRWYHVAMVRSSGTITIYKDGVSVGTPYADATNFTSTVTDLSPLSGLTMNGYLSNVRVLKGTALYTANFTPPIAPLSAIANTTLLTCQDGRFINNSPSVLTLDTNGSPTVQAFSPFGGVTSVPASYSNYFTGGSLLAVADNANLDFGSNNFTVECWAYHTSSAESTLLNKTATNNTFAAFEFYGGLTTSVYITFNDSSWGVSISGSITVTINTWNHYALTRSGNIFTLWVNGVSAGTATNSGTIPDNSTTFNIGAFANGSSPFTGYISNVRVVKGTALYTSTFTPSTTPLTTTSQSATASQVSLLTCQSATIIDNSTNYHTITATSVTPRAVNPFGTTTTTGVAYSPSVNGGSMYFDGTGDYLSTPSSAGVNISGGGSFTIECWAYITDNGGADQSFMTGDTAGGQYWDLRYQGGVGLVFRWNNASNSITGNTTFIFRAWNHCAVSWNGSTMRMFINGVVQSSTSTTSIASHTTSPLYIGYSNYAPGPQTPLGYISDARIIKGTALYTSSFVPPVASVTATATIGTAVYPSSLYLTGTSGGIIDAHGSVNLETVGNVQLAPITPYTANTGGKSLYFDGTGDYLVIPKNPSINLGAAAYTVETWFNTNTLSGQQTMISFLTGLKITIVSTGLRVWGDAGSTYQNAPATINAGTWYHMAWVRESTSLGKMYLDGSLILTVTTSNIVSSMPTDTDVLIGTYGDGFNNPYNGYLKDMRVTKGVARYTSTFTPPTSTFEVQ